MWLVNDIRLTAWIFIEVCSITRILENMFVVFYFYKVHGPTPLIFSFASFSYVVPYEPLEVQAHMLSLRFLGDTRHTLLARPWFSLVSILSASSALYFLLEALLHLLWVFSDTLAWRVLGVLRRAFLANSGRYLPRSPDSLIIGAILFSGRAQWPREPIGPGLLVWTGFVSSPSSLIFLGELIGLLKALAELSRLDCPAVGISSDCQNGYVARRLCQTPALLLFN